MNQARTNQTRTWKVVKTYTVVVDKDQPTERRTTQRDVLATRLSWREALAFQRAHAPAYILPERPGQPDALNLAPATLNSEAAQ